MRFGWVTRLKAKFATIAPPASIVLAVVLTVLWAAFCIWVPLHLVGLV
jgi:hypothetical protein